MSSWLTPGLRYMVASAFFFSIMSLLVKLASQTMPTSQIVLARCVVSLVLSYAVIRRQGISPWGKQKRFLILRGCLGFVALSCFYSAVSLLPLADATVIHYINPVFVALLAGLFLREPFGLRGFGGLLGALAGVVLLTRPPLLFGGDARLELIPVLLALAGALTAASAYTTVRKLRESEHPIVVVFYFPLIATPLCLPWALPQLVWPDIWGWLLLLGVGICTQIAQVYLTRSLHLEAAGRAMAVSYVQVVFAISWGVIFLGEQLSWSMLVGSLVIVASVMLVLRPGSSVAPSQDGGDIEVH